MKKTVKESERSPGQSGTETITHNFVSMGILLATGGEDFRGATAAAHASQRERERHGHRTHTTRCELCASRLTMQFRFASRCAPDCRYLFACFRARVATLSTGFVNGKDEKIHLSIIRFLEKVRKILGFIRGVQGCAWTYVKTVV